jgi:c-di-GMP-binding flagellar brake protein YcgR
MDIQNNGSGKIGIILKNVEDGGTISTFDCDITVVRTHTDYNPLSAFAGCSLVNMSPDAEEMLNKFIHQAQLHEIRKLNRL